MNLLIKSIDDDGRLAPLASLVTTPWDITVADHTDPPAFARALASADAVVTMTWPRSFPGSDRLRLVQLPGAGTDEIIFDAVPARASVCNAFEHEIGIAEFVLAAMLDWLIPLGRLDAEFRTGRWWGSYLCGPRHGDLHGKTIAIAGYGRIGREVARRAHAFGMRVIAASRTPGPGDDWCEAVHPISELAGVVAQAHFVLSALPLDPTTRGLFDARIFAAMRPDAVLINVGRGPTVDETALFEACRDRSIGGAVIDTWYSYPPQTGGGIPVHRPSAHPFHELENVRMIPHASAWTEALVERRCRAIARNLDHLFRGEPLANVVRGPIETPPSQPRN